MTHDTRNHFYVLVSWVKVVVVTSASLRATATAACRSDHYHFHPGSKRCDFLRALSLIIALTKSPNNERATVLRCSAWWWSRGAEPP